MCLVAELFEDKFQPYKDKTYKELDSDFKSYADLTQTGVKMKVQNFFYWVKYKEKLGHNPPTYPFPSRNTVNLHRRYNINDNYMYKYKIIEEA